MRALRTIFQVAVALLVVAAACPAQKAEMSNAEYIKQAVSAAPQAIAEGAGVVRIEKEPQFPFDNRAAYIHFVSIAGERQLFIRERVTRVEQ